MLLLVIILCIWWWTHSYPGFVLPKEQMSLLMKLKLNGKICSCEQLKIKARMLNV